MYTSAHRHTSSKFQISKSQCQLWLRDCCCQVLKDCFSGTPKPAPAVDILIKKPSNLIEKLQKTINHYFPISWIITKISGASSSVFLTFFTLLGLLIFCFIGHDRLFCRWINRQWTRLTIQRAPQIDDHLSNYPQSYRHLRTFDPFESPLISPKNRQTRKDAHQNCPAEFVRSANDRSSLILTKFSDNSQRPFAIGITCPKSNSRDR